jgi:hypothetical protein
MRRIVLLALAGREPALPENRAFPRPARNDWLLQSTRLQRTVLTRNFFEPLGTENMVIVTKEEWDTNMGPAGTPLSQKKSERTSSS